MELNKESRLQVLRAALSRLDESLGVLHRTEVEFFYTQVRDSVIQRFEFSTDIFWKCLKDVVFLRFGIAVASPRGALRDALAQKIITIEEYSLIGEMLGDRNDASHRYDEAMAEEIVKKVQRYYLIMKTVENRLSR